MLTKSSCYGCSVLFAVRQEPLLSPVSLLVIVLIHHLISPCVLLNCSTVCSTVHAGQNMRSLCLSCVVLCCAFHPSPFFKYIFWSSLTQTLNHMLPRSELHLPPPPPPPSPPTVHTDRHKYTEQSITLPRATPSHERDLDLNFTSQWAGLCEGAARGGGGLLTCVRWSRCNLFMWAHG